MPRTHTDQVNSVAVSPDGTQIATGSSDKIITLWGATSLRPLRRLHGHRNLVHDLAFDSAGQRLLSASRDNDLRLWDLVSGTTLRVFQGHVVRLWSVIVCNGHAYTAANDGTFRRWPLEDRTGQWIWDLDDQEPISARLLPDPAGKGSGALLIGFKDGAVRGYILPSETADSAATPLDTEPAATTTSGGAQVEPSPSALGALRLDLPDAHAQHVSRFALASDGQTLATAGMEGIVRVWRIRRNEDSLSLEPLHRFKQHSASVHAVGFSPDGRLLATAGYDGQVGLPLAMGRLATDQWSHHCPAVRQTPLGQAEPGWPPCRRRRARGSKGYPPRPRLACR